MLVDTNKLIIMIICGPIIDKWLILKSYSGFVSIVSNAKSKIGHYNIITYRSKIGYLEIY